MATQTTGGGSTTSFTNTPQAKDDVYNYLENLLVSDSTIYNATTNTVTLDVMSNDLGGNAKTLFSVEDGDGNALTADFDLLAKDVNAAGVSAWEQTLNHNWVRINNGKIEYRIADGSGIPGQGRSVDSLTAGQDFNDQFVYAIRLGNGTLSEATVKIHITGANDAASISVVSAETAAVEAGGDANAIPGDPNASGQLLVTDADSGENKFQTPPSLNGTYGTFTFNSTTGQWTYLLDNSRAVTEGLNQGDHVTDTLVVKSLDGSATYTITVNLTGSNDDPVATADVAVATEDGSTVTGSVATNDHDVDSSAILGFAVNGAPPAGFAMAANGSWTFDPTNSAYDHIAQGAHEDVIVSYTVTDEHGASDTASLTITVHGVNDTPDAQDDAKSGAEDTLISGSVAGNDSDADDGASLTYAPNSVPAGFAMLADGSWSLDASNAAYQHIAQGATQDVIVSYTVTDEHGASDTASLTITVNGVDDDPVLTKDANGWTYNPDTGHYYMVVDSGSVTFANALAGAHAVGGYLATIGDAAENAFITGLNPGLAVYVGASDAAEEGTFRWIEGPEQGQLLTYTNWHPGEPNNLGDEDFLHLLPGGTWNDIAGTNPGIQGYVIERNGDLTVMEQADGAADENIVVHTGSGSLSFVDPDDTDTHSASFTPDGLGYVGTFSVSADDGTDKLNWSFSVSDGALDHLAAGQVLTQSYTVTIDDGNGGTDSETVIVTMIGTNDAPIVSSAIADQSSDEDAAWSFTVPPGTFTDVDDGTVLSYSATLGNGSPLPGWLSFNAGTQTFSGTPPQDFNGSIDLKVTASDGMASASDTFTLAINAVNDAPVNTLPASFSTNEDTSVQLSGLSVSDVDAGSGTISVTLGVGSGSLTAANGGGVSVTGSGTGSLVLSGTLANIDAYLASASAPTYVPVANANGSVTLTMTTDDGGNSGAGGPLSDTDTRTITIAAVNDSAVISGAVSGSVTEDAVPNTVGGNLNSTDVDGVNDSWNAVASATASANGYGTYTMDAAGNWVFALNNANPTVNALNVGATLSDSFTVTTADGTSQVVNITINGANDPAVITGATTGSITEDAVPNTVGGNLDNSDVDNFPDAWNPVSSPTASANGYGTYTIDLAGNWVYALNNANPTVNALNNGGTLSDSFTVTSKDGTAQVVNITINGHTDVVDTQAPTDIVFNLNPASSGFTGNGLSSGDVLGAFTAVDADSTAWTFTLGGTNASLFSLSPSGSQSNVNIAAASAIASGNYTFTVTATDGAGHSFTETYHVGVGTTGADSSGGANLFTITTGTDVDFGLNGADSINGGAGDDALVGGNQNDTITGGLGADQLIGGQGNDTFVYTATNESTPAVHDTIFDFEEAGNGDSIDLHLIDANLSVANDQAFTFVAGQTAAVQNNSVTWFQDAVHNVTTIQADNNGDGVADLVITLVGIHNLTSGDFGL